VVQKWTWVCPATALATQHCWSKLWRGAQWLRKDFYHHLQPACAWRCFTVVAFYFALKAWSPIVCVLGLPVLLVVARQLHLVPLDGCSQLNIYIYVYMYAYIYMYVYMYINIYREAKQLRGFFQQGPDSPHPKVRKYLYTSICNYDYTCKYLYEYVYMHMYICIHIYICT